MCHFTKPQLSLAAVSCNPSLSCVCVSSLIRDDLLTGDFSANMKLVQVCFLISACVNHAYAR